MDQATTLRERAKPTPKHGIDDELRVRLKGALEPYPIHTTRVIAITSGKGGVGKTNVVANMAYSLSEMGKKILILDADLGLGNIDILLGLAPKYNLQHVFLGEKSLPEILITGPGEIKILPSGSGVQELSDLSEEQKTLLMAELEEIYKSVDIFLIDTGAGISSNVIYFNVAADEILVVVCPEPTSLMDAYALLKIVCEKSAEKKFGILINSVSDEREAIEVFEKLKLVAERFLHIHLNYMGYVLFDKNLRIAVKHQRIFLNEFPNSLASKCFINLARRICDLSVEDKGRNSFKLFWKRLLGKE